VDITPGCNEAKIPRFGLDKYAIVFATSQSASYAFESEPFSKLIHTFESPIVDLVATTSTCLLCHHTYDHLSLTLILKDGTTYRIDDRSAIEQVIPVVMMDKEQQTSFKAHELFGLPNVAPYNRMLLSRGFHCSLIPDLRNHDAKAILDQLWTNFQSIPERPHLDQVTFGKCKNIKFAVTELCCGRILLLSIFEGEEITFPNVEYRQSEGRNAGD
jgi:hypothetical protein